MPLITDWEIEALRCLFCINDLDSSVHGTISKPENDTTVVNNKWEYKFWGGGGGVNSEIRSIGESKCDRGITAIQIGPFFKVCRSA